MFLAWLICAAVFNLLPAHTLSRDLSRRKRSDDFTQCDKGWFQFREKCLKVRGRIRKDWIDYAAASARCKQEGGTLVTIQSKEENDFIASFLLLDAGGHVWIGLNHRNNLTQFTWEDGSSVNYTNWRAKEPSNQPDEDCAIMAFDPTVGVVGQWNDRLCRDWYGYVCQTKINRRKRSQNPQYCPAEEGGGWKFHESCFHFVPEKQNWDDAEQHCKNTYSGLLATVLDLAVDLYLDHVFSNIDRELWIGMKISNEIQQTWSSGWYVSYNQTGRDRAEIPEGTCVLRQSSKLWKITSCSERHSFLCETTKALPPVLEPPPKGSHCPEIPRDWIDLGGDYCYFFGLNKDKMLTGFEANMECNRRGGELVSLHSEEESEILQPFVKFFPAGIFIGLLRQATREDTFIWSDGTKFDYSKWHHVEPNSVAEKCVEIWGHSMEWNDVWCEGRRGYICSVKKVTPNAKVEQSVEYECSSKCYVKQILKSVIFN